MRVSVVKGRRRRGEARRTQVTSYYNLTSINPAPIHLAHAIYGQSESAVPIRYLWDFHDSCCIKRRSRDRVDARNPSSQWPLQPVQPTMLPNETTLTGSDILAEDDLARKSHEARLTSVASPSSAHVAGSDADGPVSPRPPPNRRRDKPQLSCNLCKQRK